MPSQASVEVPTVPMAAPATLAERGARLTSRRLLAPVQQLGQWADQVAGRLPEPAHFSAMPLVNNVGSVHFDPAPDGRGTVVHVELEYVPPAGPLGAAVATLLGESPSQQISADLARLKEVLAHGVPGRRAPQATRVEPATA